ncbi:MAG: hypothetical protein AAFY05_02665 [Pseudomonadota bacterium]
MEAGEVGLQFAGGLFEPISPKKKKAERALPLMSSASKLTPVPWPVVLQPGWAAADLAMRQKVLPPKTQTAMSLSILAFLLKHLVVIEMEPTGTIHACHLFVVKSLFFLLA